jgi:hypothetical protein
MLSLAFAALTATALPATPASADPTGLNNCSLTVTRPYERWTCDYVGTGAFTVVDFTQTRGDIDATITCPTFSRYYDYSTHEEILTGATMCHIEIFEYVLGSGGSGSIEVSNKAT